MENQFGIRLASARKMAGMSLQQLSDKLDKAVTKQSLNKYEQNVMKPDSELLIKIASVLGVTIDYFFRETKVKLEGIEFRKKVKLSKTEEEIIKEKTIDFLERYFELEKLLDLKSDFNQPLKNNKVKNGSDVEAYALELRNKWELGLNPIVNVIEMLEDKHIKVFEIEAPDSFDGLSAYVNDIPIIVINKSFDVVRRRFTALHELAHIILDFDKSIPEKELERMCHAFAGAFLIPKKSFIEEFTKQRNHISLEELKHIKSYYGISIQAIMARAKNLHIINEHVYKNFSINFSMLGYRKNEPGEYTGTEKSLRFQQLLYRAAAEEVISLSKAASLNNQNLSQFRKTFVVV
ncbi:MAG: helix-turn-helix domain protein [Bacteroidota bacterium]|jgi:Zn-dependent peptidase ImmA (M78 family)|nr:helix-turn-helix domain protein [Bacteroidota bacterium]